MYRLICNTWMYPCYVFNISSSVSGFRCINLAPSGYFNFWRIKSHLKPRTICQRSSLSNQMKEKSLQKIKAVVFQVYLHKTVLYNLLANFTVLWMYHQRKNLKKAFIKGSINVTLSNVSVCVLTCDINLSCCCCCCCSLIHRQCIFNLVLVSKKV